MHCSNWFDCSPNKEYQKATDSSHWASEQAGHYPEACPSYFELELEEPLRKRISRSLDTVNEVQTKQILPWVKSRHWPFFFDGGGGGGEAVTDPWDQPCKHNWFSFHVAPLLLNEIYSIFTYLQTFISSAPKKKKIKMYRQEKNSVVIAGLSQVCLSIKPGFKMDFEFIKKLFFEHPVSICHSLIAPWYLYGDSLTCVTSSYCWECKWFPNFHHANQLSVNIPELNLCCVVTVPISWSRITGSGKGRLKDFWNICQTAPWVSCFSFHPTSLICTLLSITAFKLCVKWQTQ